MEGSHVPEKCITPPRHPARPAVSIGAKSCKAFYVRNTILELSLCFNGSEEHWHLGEMAGICNQHIRYISDQMKSDCRGKNHATKEKTLLYVLHVFG